MTFEICFAILGMAICDEAGGEGWILLFDEKAMHRIESDGVRLLPKLAAKATGRGLQFLELADATSDQSAA